MSRKLRDQAQFPDGQPPEDHPFPAIFKLFGAVFGAFAVVWVVSALATLALVVAVIYFLVSAAGAF